MTEKLARALMVAGLLVACVGLAIAGPFLVIIVGGLRRLRRTR